MVDTMVRQGMTNYYLGNEVGVMDKKRWIAWALALFMVATPCMTFAQEISGAAGSTNGVFTFSSGMDFLHGE